VRPACFDETLEYLASRGRELLVVRVTGIRIGYKVPSVIYVRYSI
jgi:hypothetical protein